MLAHIERLVMPAAGLFLPATTRVLKKDAL